MTSASVAADLDERDSAGKLGEPFLELLNVVVAGGDFDFVLDLLDAALDGVGVAGAFDGSGAVLVNSDGLGLAKLAEFDVLKLDAEIFEDRLCADQQGDILQEGLAAIAEARGLDGGNLEHAAELVDDQRRQSLAFDIFGDDEQRPAFLGDLFEDRHHAGGADLLRGQGCTA